MLTSQPRCRRVETGQRQLLGLAQIGFVQLALALAIGIPVVALPVVLAPDGKGAQRVSERKRPLVLSA